MAMERPHAGVVGEELDDRIGGLDTGRGDERAVHDLDVATGGVLGIRD